MRASRTEKEWGLRVRCATSSLFQLCLLVYVAVGWLEAGEGSKLLLALAAAVNLGIYALVRFGGPELLPLAHKGAPLVGVLLWGGLNLLAGGNSLFLVGFWFEILLSSVSHSVFGITCVTLASAGVLVAQHLMPRIEVGLGQTVLQLTSLGLVGGGAAWVRSRWIQRQERFSTTLDEQQQRLEAIEEKLADAQTLADLGAQTARIGHGLKNAVHSLRGFSTLIERGLEREGGQAAGNAALEGLKSSIDQLERLALDTLQPEAPASQDSVAAPVTGSAPKPDSDLREVLDAEVAEVSRVHPELRCRIVWEGDGGVRVPGRVLREVMSNLLLNAAESMGREGEITIHVTPDGEDHVIGVTDTGPGIAPEIHDKLFRPGHSTKSGGHGMGLYLSRSLVQSLGGDLSLRPSESGASFHITLPSSRANGARP